MIITKRKNMGKIVIAEEECVLQNGRGWKASQGRGVEGRRERKKWQTHDSWQVLSIGNKEEIYLDSVLDTLLLETRASQCPDVTLLNTREQVRASVTGAGVHSFSLSQVREQ